MRELEVVSEPRAKIEINLKEVEEIVNGLHFIRQDILRNQKGSKARNDRITRISELEEEFEVVRDKLNMEGGD